MTRARESEEVSEVEEEKATNIVSDWDSPDLAVDLVDQIWDMVKGWLTDRELAASDFFYYCRNLCDNLEEADEVWVWMLNLIAHFVAEDERICHGERGRLGGAPSTLVSEKGGGIEKGDGGEGIKERESQGEFGMCDQLSYS